MLFKPWRDVKVDLKEPEQTWAEAFERFHETLSLPEQSQLSNIQYFYQCELSAQQHRDSQDDIIEEHSSDTDVDENIEEYFPSLLQPAITAEDINRILVVKKARAARIFSANKTLPDEVHGAQPRDGDQKDVERLTNWKNQLMQQAQGTWTGDDELCGDRGGDVLPLSEASKTTGSVAHLIRPEEALSAIKPDMLNIDQ